MAIPLSTEDILIQKLDYVHENPTIEKWNLCESAEDYIWSSDGFYESGIDNFKILTDFRD